MPAGATVTYYNNSNIAITPFADVNGVDCSVYRFELYFPELVPFETSFTQEGADYANDGYFDPLILKPFGYQEKIIYTGDGLEMYTYDWFEELVTFG